MNETPATDVRYEEALAARALDVDTAWLDQIIETDVAPAPSTEESMVSCRVCRGTGNIVVDHRPAAWRCLGCRGRGWIITGLW
jgi:hypothetical protein